MVIFRAPIAPGRSLNIVGDLKKKSASPASALFSLLPVWLNHLMALNFGDQDYIIMVCVTAAQPVTKPLLHYTPHKGS